MNRYEPAMPRATFGLIAVAMTAITIGMMVVLPAKVDSGSSGAYTLAAAKASTTAPVEVAVDTARGDVPAAVELDERLAAREAPARKHKWSWRIWTHS